MVAKTITREELEKRKAEVLTTANRRILYDLLLSGWKNKDAAKQAKLQPRYVENLVSKTGINELVLRERAFISQKAVQTAELTAEDVIDKFRRIFVMAEKKGDLTNMSRSAENLGRIMGIYERDNEQQTGRMALADLLVQASRKQVESRSPVDALPAAERSDVGGLVGGGDNNASEANTEDNGVNSCSSGCSENEE